MALQCSVSISELGLPTETPMLGIPIDYSNGYSTFAKTFVETARELCPVRTGYLRSTIGCEVTADGVVCTVGASYAQYVEYGTWNSPAQPFMEPALEAAQAAAAPEMQQSYDEAVMQEEEMLGIISERIGEEIEGGAIADGIKANGGVGGIGGGGIYQFIVTFLVTLIVGLIVTLIDTITSYDQGEAILYKLYDSGFSPIVDVIDGAVEIEEEYEEEEEKEEEAKYEW